MTRVKLTQNTYYRRNIDKLFIVPSIKARQAYYDEIYEKVNGRYIVSGVPSCRCREKPPQNIVIDEPIVPVQTPITAQWRPVGGD